MGEFGHGSVSERLTRSAATLAAVAVILGSTGLVPAQSLRYDLLIKNAHVVDGTGSPWFRADIGRRGDVIATIAPRID